MAERGAQPGNLNQSKNKPWRAAIDRAIAQGDPDKLRRIAEKLLNMAEEGDIAAIKEVGDRIDGKAVATVQGPTEDGAHIIRAEHLIVDPADKANG